MQALQQHGIHPVVTLYHWDLPEALEQQGGWRNASIVDAFTQYAGTCFAHFGPYVKLWITINEPFVISWLGHGLGIHAPGRCSSRSQCPEGDSATEPYLVAHHLLLSHAKAYQLFQDVYKSKLNTKIGISLNSDWIEPWRADSDLDKEAAQRYLDFSLGWFADPIFFGDYPASMKHVAALPVFTEEQKSLLKGSTDFFGLNHYTSSYAIHGRSPGQYGWANDSDVTPTQIGVDNKTIGTPSGCSWLFVVPQGFRKLLNYIKNRYNNTDIFVTENGVSVPGEASMPMSEALSDKFRSSYLNDYMNQMLLALEDGVRVKGYFIWSLMDNFEWADGYEVRFGLYYVDYTNNRTRLPKESLSFLKAYITDYTEPEWRWLWLLFGIPSLAVLGIIGYCVWRDRISESKYNIVDS
uniref:beta-glucosidase n=1 Tax=Arcella intermedia TaxID=1963864 RepID=A0A6B2L265_9EUKA